MNKKPSLPAVCTFATRFRNIHAVHWSRLLTTMVSLLFCSLALSYSASVTLAWNASSGSGVTGYKLRYGTTSGNPSQVVDVGNTTTATASNLNDGTTYYFTVVAYNAAGIESQPSNEVSYATPTSGLTTYVLTVHGGTGGGNYAPGTQVQVSANSSPAGQVFGIWTGDYQILANPSSSNTTATMPSGHATITATYAAASGSGAQPQNQVVALSFREGNGTAVADGSGSDHAGTLINGPSWTTGKFGNAIALDGSNDYVLIANPDTLNFGTADFTIAAWVKRQATGEENTILSKTGQVAARSSSLTAATAG
jgi:Fibronectin type III domain/Divergent InlB B-repeat domain